MSSRSSDRGRLVRILSMLAVVASLGSTAMPVTAGEARGRGRKAIITWLDGDGKHQEADARKVRYGYFVRRYLSAPKDGKTYKDKEHTEKALPIAGAFTHFARIDSIEFTWEPVPDSEGSRLNLKVTLPDGKVRMVSGTELAGAQHTESPYIAFTAEGVEHRIELNPLGSEEARRGKPRLLSIVFYL